MTKIVIGLLSCDKYEARADLCRKTWIKHAKDVDIPVYFLRGGAKEFRQQGDVLYFPVPTSYETLPQRTRAFAEWFLKNTDADVAFKADCDSLVIPERLAAYEHLDKPYFGNEPGGPYVGYCSGGSGYGLSRCAAEIIATYMTTLVGAEDVWTNRTLRQHGIQPYFEHPRRFISWGADKPDRIPTRSNNIISTHQIPTELWWRVYRDMYG